MTTLDTSGPRRTGRGAWVFLLAIAIAGYYGSTADLQIWRRFVRPYNPHYHRASWGQILAPLPLSEPELVPIPTPRPRKKPRRVTCPIVTDPGLDTFFHELAHCNGWTHPEHPKPADYWIPLEYLRPFDGHLKVTITGGGSPEQIREYAQRGTDIRVSTKTADQLCVGANQPVVGCSWPPS